ncbi:MAG: flavocytochrome c [Burkholderiales bacterium]|nr:flavocytochrome c [Burkholderiales bacterium]
MGSAAILWSPSLFAQERREQVEVVVIGAGGAGLAAAIVAADAGARVIVLEKMPVVGGNTQLAAGGMNAAGTRVQSGKGIKDEWQWMYEDTMKGGRNRNQPELVEIMTKGSAGAVEWLEGLGAQIPGIVRSGGARADRTHQPVGGPTFGPYITRVLLDNVVRRKVPVRRNSKVVEILQKPDGAMRGVVVQDRRGGLYTIETQAIVIASGGYGSNPKRVAELRPDLANFTSTGQPGTTGDAIDLASRIGAEVFDLDQIQIHPTQAVGAKTLISETVRGAGAILVNRDGKRFVNEVTTRDKASAAVLAQKGRTAFLVFDEGVKGSMSMMEGYFHLGLVREATTLEALAARCGIDAANLASTVEAYNRYQAQKHDAEFERDDMARPIARPSYYAIEVNPGIHFTMGGIRINGRTQVMSRDKRALPGLYAAGEVTGGVHGANRLGGNAMTALFTFGPIAGREAASYAKTGRS